MDARTDGLEDPFAGADGPSDSFWSAFDAGGGQGEEHDGRRRRPAVAVVIAFLVIAAVVGAGFGVLTGHHFGSSTPATANSFLPSVATSAIASAPASAKASPTGPSDPTGSTVPVTATTSYDPSGGSGFATITPGSYETQHYATPAFGGLKPDVGLLLDLGRARTISAVEVTSAAAGTQGGLIGLDAPPTAGSAPAGAASADLSGRTRLTPGSGGQHRYWLLVVTKLGDDGQGRYYAQLSGIRVLS